MRSNKLRIKLNDYHASEEEIELVVKVMRSGKLSEGEMVEQFEKTWAKYVGTKYCVAFSSGTAALFCGLLAARDLQLIRGSIVLTNPNTYIATANCISMARYSLGFPDVEPDSFGKMSIPEIARFLSQAGSHHQVGAIVVVHIIGLPEQMIEIMQLGVVNQRNGTLFKPNTLA